MRKGLLETRQIGINQCRPKLLGIEYGASIRVKDFKKIIKNLVKKEEKYIITNLQIIIEPSSLQKQSESQQIFQKYLFHKQSEHITQFFHALKNDLPYLKELRLIVSFPFKMSNIFAKVGFFQYVQEAPDSQDTSPNWTNLITLQPHILKLQYISKFILKEEAPIIRRQLRKKLERVDKERGWMTFIRVGDQELLKQIIKIKQWDCLNLKISRIDFISLQPIKDTIFNILTHLSITHCKIQTIGPLCRLRANNLLSLQLEHNQIYDISILKKLRWKDLNILSLEDNCIRCIDVFELVDWPLLRVMRLQPISSIKKYPSSQSIRPLLKVVFKNEKYKIILVRSHGRISEFAVYKSMYKKTKNILIQHKKQPISEE